MDFLLYGMERLCRIFCTASMENPYQTPVHLVQPCRKHMYNMSTCIVQQPTGQSATRRGPDDYEPVNLNHSFTEIECPACNWEWKGCNVAKSCSIKNVICKDCNKKAN
jgi:hypothetical protein